MDLKNKMLSCIAVSMLLPLSSCQIEDIETIRGELPDEETLDNVYGFLRSYNTSGNEINLVLMQGNGFVTSNFYYQFNKPTDISELNADVDAGVVPEAESVRTLLTEQNYEFPDGKKLNFTKGKKISDIKRVKFLAKGLDPGEYYLPITIDGTEGKENQSLCFNLSIREPYLGEYELEVNDDVISVFYVDVDKYQPLLANAYIIEKWTAQMNRDDPKPELLWTKTFGNIVNLRRANVSYDQNTGRAILGLNANIRHVLENAVKYIHPLQEKGRKVLLCIEGGGNGLGFCNMTDKQIGDFVSQIKSCVNTYGLDGVNLWDRNSAYEKAEEKGLPEMNTTSYPKLIKELKAALGEKLVTVVDHERPTEYFHNETACGGIKVGEHIDYAWSGYSSLEFPAQIHDPWNPNFTSQYNSVCTPETIHKPMAGLDKRKYGCLSCTFSSPDIANPNYTGYDFVWDWKLQYKDSRGIMVINDIRDNIQNDMEGVWSGLISEIYRCFAKDGQIKAGSRGSTHRYIFAPDLRNEDPYSGGYGKWLKDW